jgi:hypothetical protein
MVPVLDFAVVLDVFRAFEREGVRVPCATARMVYRMKKDTVRRQDRADAARLREHFQLDEE